MPRTRAARSAAHAYFDRAAVQGDLGLHGDAQRGRSSRGATKRRVGPRRRRWRRGHAAEKEHLGQVNTLWGVAARLCAVAAWSSTKEMGNLNVVV